MDNIELVGGVKIPQGWYDIPDECLVKKDDKIAMVSIQNLAKKEHTVTWLSPDETEVGKVKRFSGRVVIRQV